MALSDRDLKRIHKSAVRIAVSMDLPLVPSQVLCARIESVLRLEAQRGAKAHATMRRYRDGWKRVARFYRALARDNDMRRARKVLRAPGGRALHDWQEE